MSPFLLFFLTKQQQMIFKLLSSDKKFHASVKEKLPAKIPLYWAVIEPS